MDYGAAEADQNLNLALEVVFERVDTDMPPLYKCLNLVMFRRNLIGQFYSEDRHPDQDYRGHFEDKVVPTISTQVAKGDLFSKNQTCIPLTS